jgi:hypothetical protein
MARLFLWRLYRWVEPLVTEELDERFDVSVIVRMSVQVETGHPHLGPSLP